MIEGHDIVLFTYADWRATQSTPQHLARLLAEKNRVLFVDMPRSFLRFLKGADPQGGGVWEGSALQEVRPGLFVYHAMHRFLPVGHLPFGVGEAALNLNGRALARQLRPILDELEFREILLWNFSPIHGGAVARMQRRLSIHDICDEWANYLPATAGRRLVESVDCRLAREADLVFVFSDYMRRRREGLNPETHVVLPAGDVEHYTKAALSETAVPEDIAALPKPVIGAICVVDPARFDVHLIAHLARTRPDWSVVVLGPIRTGMDLSPLKPLPNAHVMNNRPLEDMPRYLKGMDVAIIPYQLNDATRGIYPMKTQEYLAGGKPVVSPRLPACASLAEVMYFADSYDDFVDKVALALRDNSPERIAARRAVAARNTWRSRLEERSAHIGRLMRQP